MTVNSLQEKMGFWNHWRTQKLWVLATCLLSVLLVQVGGALAAEIVYERNGAIWKMDDDGTNEVALSSPSGSDSDSAPTICDNGRYIYFQRNDGSQSDLWRMSKTGSLQTNITNSPAASEQTPNCGTNGIFTYVLYRSTHEDPIGDIYRMNLDGTNVFNITADCNGPSCPGGAVADLAPAWCGTNSLVFSRFDGVNDLEVYKIDLDGTDLTQLTDNDDNAQGVALDDVRPICNSLGTKVLFGRGPISDYYDLFEQVIATGAEENLTGGFWEYGDERTSDYSPGGTSVTFHHDGFTPGSGGIFRLSLTQPGALPEQLTEDPLDEDPEWAELN